MTFDRVHCALPRLCLVEKQKHLDKREIRLSHRLTHLVIQNRVVVGVVVFPLFRTEMRKGLPPVLIQVRLETQQQLLQLLQTLQR